jgi:hypothetical protein
MTIRQINIRQMNRREWIAGAMALLSEAHLPMALAGELGGGAQKVTAEGLEGPPKSLLSSTFSPEVLARSLASPAEWHPFPKAEEREAWEAVPADLKELLVKRAERVLGTPWETLTAAVLLEFKRTGDRTDHALIYKRRRDRLNDLVLGECIEGKGRFMDEIANGVWLTCEETFWGFPAHLAMQKAGVDLPDAAEPVVDLFAAQTASTVALIDYLLGTKLDQVSPLIRKRIRLEAKRRILDPAFLRDDFWWMWNGNEGSGHRLNNWNPWINSNLLTTNLLLEPDAARRRQAISKILRGVDKYLEQYSPDGGCEEGPGYFVMSACTFYECCWTMESATGGAGRVLTHPFIKKMEHFIADVHIAGDYYVNYADAHGKDGPPAELIYRIGAGVGDTALKEFGAFHVAAKAPAIDAPRLQDSRYIDMYLSRMVPDILSTAEARRTPKVDALERDSWYPALKLMTARAKAGTTDGFYLAVQAAQNQRSHGHNDSGSFIVFHDGKPVFIDVGPEAYSAKTFSPDRYSIWTMQSAYHNLPTVGGVMQSSQKAEYKASNVIYANDEAHAGLRMNLATAYPVEAGIAEWNRSIVLERNENRVRLTEDFKLGRKASVALTFMTPRLPDVGKAGRVTMSVVDGSGSDVALVFDPALAAATFEKILLKDDDLRRIWGENLYRVLLTSTAPTDGGKWTIDIV